MNIDIDNYKETEADTAAEFYHRCQELGFVVKMEVKLPSEAHRSGTMRADAIVFDLGKAVCAVEFKSHRKHAAKPGSRQHRAYCGLGIPFFYCCGNDEIDETIHNVCALAEL